MTSCNSCLDKYSLVDPKFILAMIIVVNVYFLFVLVYTGIVNIIRNIRDYKEYGCKESFMDTLLGKDLLALTLILPITMDVLIIFWMIVNWVSTLL